jgi:hypothetical protein
MRHPIRYTNYSGVDITLMLEEPISLCGLEITDVTTAPRLIIWHNHTGSAQLLDPKRTYVIVIKAENECGCSARRVISFQATTTATWQVLVPNQVISLRLEDIGEWVIERCPDHQYLPEVDISMEHFRQD